MRPGHRLSLALRLVVVSSLVFVGNAWGQQPVPQQVPTQTQVTITPSPVVFAETSPGQTSAPVIVTVKNPGTAATTLPSAASLSAAAAANFAITGNTCVSPLAAGATCTITLDFAPPTNGSPANGAKTGTMTVPNGTYSTTVALQGQAGMATFGPAPLTFAPTMLGQTSAAQTTTLTNNSTAATTITANGAAAATAGYTVMASTCTANTQIPVGGSCSVTVAFSPTAVGTQTGTVTVTDDIGTQTVSLSGVGLLVNPAVTVFPAEAVGSTESANVTFTFGGPGTVSTFNIVTQGSQSLDFSAGVQSGSGYCRPAAGTYATGSTCTVAVNFKPITPGLATGAVYLYDNESTPQLIGIGYVNGMGTGPMAALYPGTQTTLFAGTAGDAFGLAVDLNGDVFYDNSNAGNVTKQTFAQSAYTATTLGSGLGNFSNFAIDGAGYVFVTSSGITEETYTPATTSYTQSTAISGVGAYAVAIDGSNSLYVASGNKLYKETPAGGSYSATTISTSFNTIIGLAVDSSNNLYVADAGNAALYELPYTSGTYASSPTTIATGLVNVNSVSVDAAGTVYTVADGSYGGVLRYAPATGGGFTMLPVVGSFGRANGVVLDRRGNLYVTDDGGGNAVDEINVSGTESFAFANTVVGATSATQTATLVNTGNTPMTVTGLTILGPFSSSTTLSSCATLAPGASCVVPIAFTPTVPGAASGYLQFTDNALGIAGTTQLVNLTGTGYENLVFTTAPPAALQTGQNAGTVVVSVEKSGGLVDTAQNPPVTLTVTGPGSYSQTYGPTTPVNGVVSFNTTANALTAVGAYSYSASSTTANFTATPAASEVVSAYKLAMTGVVTPQAASNTTTNAVTVSVVTSSGAATTQTNAITLTVSGPTGYTTQTYGPTSANATTGAVTFTTNALTLAGTYTYTASSTASPGGVAVTGTSTTQVITAAAGSAFTVTPASTTAVVGYADNITVSAYDAFGNLATSYAGTVMLSSTDPGPATLPAPFTLSAGTATQPVTFKTVTTTGWTVTATDTVNASIMGTSVAISVQPNPSFVVTSSAGDTSGACTNQAATGATADSACTVYAAFAAVTALNNASVTSYVPTITFAPSLTAAGPLTITMLQPISATGNVSLIGPGAVTNSITLSGGNATTFLAAGGNAVTNFTGLTFANFKGTVSTVLTGNGTMTFTNDVFTGNNYTSNSNNGGVMGINGNITVMGCTFTNNVSAGGGGALASTPTALVISNSFFAGNTAASYGGALYSFGMGPVTITNSAFVGNTTTAGSGGAVYFNTTAPLTVTNGTFNSNTATVDGGAIYTTGLYTITNSSFTSNSILGSSTSYGGAIYGTNGGVNSISSTNFIGNFSSSIGANAIAGALYADHVNLTNVLFSGNYVKSMTTSYGGAVEMTGNYTSTWTGVTLTGNCTAPPSNATPPMPCAGAGATIQNGGAVYQQVGTINLYNGTVTGNSAKNGGGWYKASGALNAYNSVISGNAATSSYRDIYPSVTNFNSYIDVNTGPTCTSAFCNPLLSALGNYGGGSVGATVNATAYTTPVQTMLPLPGSPLLAAGGLSYVGTPGTLSGGATTDARGTGYPRTLTEAGSNHVDIGAAEANYSLSFVTQPSNTALGAMVTPAPTVQLLESGNAGGDGVGTDPGSFAGGMLAVTAAPEAASTATVATTASGLESLNESFATAAGGETLTVLAQSGAATPVTVANATSGTFEITSGSIVFTMAPAPAVTMGGSAGTVQVALTNPGGGTNTAATAAVTLTVTGPSGYSQSYGPTAAVNGVVSFNLSAATLTATGNYLYTATAAAYTPDAATAYETVGGGGVWVLDANGVLVELNMPGTVGSASGTASFGGVAFDHAGDLWSVNAAANALTYVGAGTTTSTGYTGGGLSTPVSVAVDGAGYVWVANSGNNALSEFTNAGTAASPTTGLGGSDGLSAPSAVVIDSAGSLWVANKAGNNVTHIFGVAAPVVTPLAQGTAAGTLGVRP